MLEAIHVTSQAARKGNYALPPEYDGVVNQGALYHAVRAFRNNQRQGTHATKTRGLVSGGNQKPWRQKGTGRARQGSTRAPQWPGGGTAFGPLPRSYRTDVNRKLRRLARRSALNARAQGGQFFVIEELAFERPKTSQMAGLLDKLELTGRKVLLLTAGHKPMVYLSARNIPGVRVMAYPEAAAYDVLWGEAIVVEEAAVGGHAIAGSAKGARAKRAERAEKGGAKRPAARAKKGTVKAPKRAPKTAKASKKKKTTDD